MPESIWEAALRRMSPEDRTSLEREATRYSGDTHPRWRMLQLEAEEGGGRMIDTLLIVHAPSPKSDFTVIETPDKFLMFRNGGAAIEKYIREVREQYAARDREHG